MGKNERVAILTLSMFCMAPLFFVVVVFKMLEASSPVLKDLMTQPSQPEPWSVLIVLAGVSLSLGLAVYLGGLLWVVVMKHFLPKEIVRRFACYGSESMKRHVHIVESLLR